MTGDLPGSGVMQGPFGKYLLLLELGRGGMGIVFEAIDQELNRPVALKMLLPTLSATPEEAAQDQERFIREARLSANIPKHPHIVGVYEAGVIEGHRYIAMEYVRGKQMSLWSREASVTPRQKLTILRDIARAVHVAHQHGVIHRDLKPDNVLIDAQGAPHVMDFGLAKRMTDSTANAGLTIQGLIVGTPAYMSPEQAEGRREVDARTDIYSLGVILFEILAGRVPYQGASPIQVIMKLIQDPTPSPSKVAESRGHKAIDPVLERVCLKAMSKKAQDRYATAGEFAEDLTAHLEGRPVAAAVLRKVVKKPGSTVRGVRAGSESPRKTWWLAGVAGGLLILGFLAWILGRDERPPVTPIDYAPAETLLAQGRAEDSLREFEIILRAHPGDDRALGGVRRGRAAIASRKGKDAERLVEEGDRLLSGGQLPEALMAFTQALERDPESARALRGQKEARRRIGEGNKPVAVVPPGDEKPRAVEAPPVPPPSRPAPREGPAPPAGVPSYAATAVDPSTLSPGLIGEYFSDIQLTRPALTRLDPELRFRWSGGQPWPGGPSSYWSARWSGYLRAPKTGLYTLRITSDDGMRLFLGESQVIANWTDHSETTDVVQVWLAEGLHRMRLEYYQGVAYATMILGWSDPDGSSGPILPEFFSHSKGDYKPLAVVAPAPAVVELSPEAAVWTLFVSERDKLKGQTVTFPSPGKADGTAVIREIAEKEILFSVNVAGGGIFQSKQTGESLPPVTLMAMSRLLWPRPTPEQLKLVCGALANRGDLESAWKEVERSRSAGTDPRESSAFLLARERARIDQMASPLERSQALRKLLSSRSSLLDADQKKSLTAELAGPEPGARPLAPKLQEPFTIAGHAGEARSPSFSPDGKWLATAGWDSTVKIWDLSTGQIRTTIKASSPVWGVAWSGDSKTVGYAEFSGTVRLADAFSGADRVTFSGHSTQSFGVALSRDGSFVVSCSTDNSARVWDAATGKERMAFHDHPLGAVSLALSPDNKLIAVGSAEHVIKIWDLASKANLFNLEGHSQGIWALSFSADGRTLVSGSRDGTAKIWDLGTRKERQVIRPATSEVWGVGISPDGRLVATTSKEGNLELWEASSGRPLASVRAHTAYARYLAFSPSGKHIATCGWEPSVRVYEISGITPGK